MGHSVSFTTGTFLLIFLAKCRQNEIEYEYNTPEPFAQIRGCYFKIRLNAKIHTYIHV